MKIRSHRELGVYRLAFDAAMRIFELTKSFPKEGLYSIYDDILGKLVNMVIHPENWTIKYEADKVTRRMGERERR